MAEPFLTETAGSYDCIVQDYEARASTSTPQRAAFRAGFGEALLPHGVVLDAGCGPGHDLVYFDALGLRTLGPEASTGMAERVRARRLPVARGDLRRPPVRCGSLNGIWSSASLLHVPRAEVPGVLATWHSLLRPGGHLGLITSLGVDEGWEVVPYKPDTQHQDTPLRRWFVHHERAVLERRVAETGFRLQHIEVREGHRQWLQLLAIKVGTSSCAR